MSEKRSPVNLMSEMQKRALQCGYELAEAAELLTNYLHRIGERDDHLAGLINLVGRARTSFETGCEEAYREHEAAEDAANAEAAGVVQLAGKRARKAASR